MQLEAHADAFIRDINAFVEAHVLAIDRYLSGHLDRNEERPLAALAPGPNAPEPGPAGIRFEGKQAVLHRLAERRAGLAMQATAAGDEGAWERLRADAGKPGHRPIVCSGRPGTGKTTVLHRNVRETLAAGGSVLVTIPTARQSTRMAAKLGAHDRLVVETAAAAFQFHKPEQEALYAIYGYDLVVVDEFSQLDQEQFDFCLLQYVYDLHLWTDLGSKKNQADGTAMRLMMAGHPMSPLYWQDIKYGLFDLVQQLGYPDLYWTLAPWEQSLPYHQYLLDEMQKLLAARTFLPPFEAMHMARVMLQVCRNLVAGGGRNRANAGKWTRHLLGGKLPDHDVDNCICFFTRVEYQDGSRKEGTQRYHGSGRPHIHALFWLRDMGTACLENVMAATEDLGPDMEAVAAFVRGSQRDRGGDSGWPVHEGPSAYDEDAEKLQLHHTADDAAEGVRGYFVPVMDALRCHQDVQIAQGRGLLLTYVTKYVAKWSDSS